VYESKQQPSLKNSSNIYLLLMQIYLNPRKTTASFEMRLTNLLSPQNTAISRGSAPSVKSKGGRGSKKIAEIEGAEDTKVSLSSTDSSKSDGDADEFNEGGSTIMLDEVLDLLSRRWDRINGAQALKLLPRETKLQVIIACSCIMTKNHTSTIFTGLTYFLRNFFMLGESLNFYQTFFFVYSFC